MERARTPAERERPGERVKPPAPPAPPAPVADILRLQASAGNAAVARLMAGPSQCACGGRLAPGESECAECRSRRLGAEGAGAAVARDGLQPGDTAPQDDVDIAAGGRARSNALFGRQCEPWSSAWEANLEQMRLRLLVPNIVEAALGGPAAGDVADVWRRYIDGRGGMEVHDGIAQAGDRIAAAFRNDERHAAHEDAVMDWVRGRVRTVVLPQLAGATEVRLTLDDLGVPQNLRTPVPDYDNDAFTVAANLAGGIGTSDFGVDSRRLDGAIGFTKTVDPGSRLWCRVQLRAEFDWTVRDGIDFCPGNAGNAMQEALTIPLSRLEASGRARDVGLLVRFRRVRYDVPQEFPNPDIQ